MPLLNVILFVALSILFVKPETLTEPAPRSEGLPVGQALERAVNGSRLTQPGATPFHLRASSAPAYSYSVEHRAEIEEYWVAPDKWRRTIRAKEFEQTIVVNGKQRFEQNSSDYYPKWLDDVVSALFEVVPPQTLEQLAKLNAQIPAPDGKAGEWRVSYSPSSTDGKVTVTWGGGLNFERKTGLLTWISGTGFAAGFKNYKEFHGKAVARLLETFPPVPRGDVKTEITELSDLHHPDETLFAIPEPTPPEQQIRTVQVPEVEYRKLAIDPPPMKLPPVKVRPTSGSFATYIVTDRTGKVRECRFIISNNMTIAEGAIEQVKRWTFRPLLIDGVPVQVETTLTFGFETDITGEQAAFEPASYYFKRGRDLTYPRTDGSPAFHIKGTFEGAGIFTAYRGTYEETWLAPNRWRRQVTIGKVTATETRIDDDHYRSVPPLETARVVERVLSLFGAEFPGFAYYSPDTDWHMADVEFEGISVTRVAMGRMGDDGQMQNPRAYYFDQAGLVRARTNLPETITYDEFVEFAGKQVPHRIDSKMNSVHTLTALIDLLEPAQPMPDEFFRLRGVKPTEWVRPSPW